MQKNAYNLQPVEGVWAICFFGCSSFHATSESAMMAHYVNANCGVGMNLLEIVGLNSILINCWVMKS